MFLFHCFHPSLSHHRAWSSPLQQSPKESPYLQRGSCFDPFSTFLQPGSTILLKTRKWLPVVLPKVFKHFTTDGYGLEGAVPFPSLQPQLFPLPLSCALLRPCWPSGHALEHAAFSPYACSSLLRESSLYTPLPKQLFVLHIPSSSPTSGLTSGHEVPSVKFTDAPDEVRSLITGTFSS